MSKQQGRADSLYPRCPEAIIAELLRWAERLDRESACEPKSPEWCRRLDAYTDHGGRLLLEACDAGIFADDEALAAIVEFYWSSVFEGGLCWKISPHGPFRLLFLGATLKWSRWGHPSRADDQSESVSLNFDDISPDEKMSPYNYLSLWGRVGIWVGMAEQFRTLAMLIQNDVQKGGSAAEGVTLPPLSKKAAIAWEILVELPAHRGLTGTQLVDALNERGVDSDQSTLTRWIIPPLKARGVENKRKIGYFIPTNKRPGK